MQPTRCVRAAIPTFRRQLPCLPSPAASSCTSHYSLPSGSLLTRRNPLRSLIKPLRYPGLPMFLLAHPWCHFCSTSYYCHPSVLLPTLRNALRSLINPLRHLQMPRFRVVHAYCQFYSTDILLLSFPPLLVVSTFRRYLYVPTNYLRLSDSLFFRLCFASVLFFCLLETTLARLPAILQFLFSLSTSTMCRNIFPMSSIRPHTAMVLLDATLF